MMFTVSKRWLQIVGISGFGYHLLPQHLTGFVSMRLSDRFTYDLPVVRRSGFAEVETVYRWRGMCFGSLDRHIVHVEYPVRRVHRDDGRIGVSDVVERFSAPHGGVIRADHVVHPVELETSMTSAGRAAAWRDM